MHTCGVIVVDFMYENVSALEPRKPQVHSGDPAAIISWMLV